MKRPAFSASDLNRIADLAGIKGNLTQDVLDNLKQQLHQTLKQPAQSLFGQSIRPTTYQGKVPQPTTYTKQFRYDKYSSPPPPSDEEDKFIQAWRNSSMSTQWRKWTTNLSGKEVAKVWLDEGKGVLCARFPYKQEVIDDIRARVPKGKKTWNDSEKIWEFSVETIQLIVDILSKHFEEVLDLTQATAPAPMGPISSDPLLSLLDEEDIGRIYKLLAIKYHPDKQGGNSDKMARINNIFSKRGKEKRNEG